MAESIQVAVRVRPFDKREKDRKAKLIISMNGNQTEIRNPANQNSKQFTFDYSYWSHDSFREREDGYLEPNGNKYADQEKVFNDLGRGVLANAWKGFNCSLFAYGQTGSGKSYSIMGYGNNKGIVPMICEELFKEIEKKRSTAGKDEEYQVEMSMLEIYNEHVRDLLNIKETPIGGLKVREHGTKGFFVDKLKTFPTNSYNDIEMKREEGTRNRTLATTNMNATSSRAHTIVSVTFTQKAPNDTGEKMTRTATINLVDLAGSERAASTGATGDRLKEGSKINQSLSNLGNVIKALADQAYGKTNIIVPYRNSTLTRLLKNALGGNSKTIMIAALSPADVNYEETLSTLKFADRAKAIKTSPTVNESPTDKIIRELKEENARLLQLMKSGGVGEFEGYTKSEMQEMKKALEEEMMQKIEDEKKTWQQRLAEAEKENLTKVEQERQKMEQRKTIPHFWNLNEDPSLTAMIIHFCMPGVSHVGNGNSKTTPEIMLKGLSVQSNHATVTNDNGVTSILPLGGAKVLVNGVTIQDKTVLHHNDRIMFGSNHLYVFHNPKDEALRLKAGTKTEPPSFTSAQEEIAAESSGMGKLMKHSEGKSKEDLLLMEELLKILPMVNEANAMAEELKKNVKFKVTLCQPKFVGEDGENTKVCVSMKQPKTGNEWLWEKDKFINRKYLMQDMYQNYMEGDKNWDLPKELDPFWEPADMEILIGAAPVFISSLANGMEMEQDTLIRDFKGNDKGKLLIEVWPCTAEWKEIIDNVSETEELMNKPMYVKVKICSGSNFPSNINSTFCKLKFYMDTEFTKTCEVKGSNPVFNHTCKFTIPKVNDEVVQYLKEDAIYIQLWGRQKEGGFGILKNTRSTPPPNPVKNEKVEKEDEEYKRAVEFSAMQKRAERAEKKLAKVRSLMEGQGANSKGDISQAELSNAMDSGQRFKGVAAAVMAVNDAGRVKGAKEKKGTKNKSKTCSLQ